jgi:hypothetical protein
LKPKTLKQLIRLARDFAQGINRRKPDAEDIAHEKRTYERQLRAAGHSRRESMRLVSEHFRNRG